MREKRKRRLEERRMPCGEYHPLPCNLDVRCPDTRFGGYSRYEFTQSSGPTTNAYIKLPGECYGGDDGDDGEEADADDDADDDDDSEERRGTPYRAFDTEYLIQCANCHDELAVFPNDDGGMADLKEHCDAEHNGDARYHITRPADLE